ncbi:pyridine nucleotide-disulfide oxidoreductase, partial [bacterium]|nr:pyridine nucleotide-disulfide oxidoreductase [bacterium]
RKASDFLMSLQLSGAFKKNLLANLHLELPAVVIGGGLTAFDTATEMLAYYPVQVEKALVQFEALTRDQGEDAVWAQCTEEEKETLKTFLEHGRAIRAERQAADRERRAPNFIPLCRSWGGVNVVYRKRLQDSPAYRLNHEEVRKAFEEGIGFVENATPVEVIKGPLGTATALRCRRADGSEVTLPARSIAVAAGTHPNTTYEKEFPGTFKLDGNRQFFAKYGFENESGPEVGKTAGPGFFLSYEKEGKYVSFYGDNHPDYAGNVVKAMASAKHGAPQVARLFARAISGAESGTVSGASFENTVKKLDRLLLPTVARVNRLTPKIVEVIVKAPLAAKKFQPGQFYRLQNFESEAHAASGYRLSMEGLALTGAWVDREKDLLSLIVLEMGASSKLCALLKPGEPLVVMGPTGAPSEIPKRKKVVLVGGGLGNAVLLSISEALRANGCKVVYFAGYREAADLFHQDMIEAATDQVVWAVDSGEKIAPRRPKDLSFQGNIVKALVAYASGKLQEKPLLDFKKLDHLLVIGSDKMMGAVAQARHGVLKPYLNPNHVALGSINSPMQCMMKEICAQCLQRHVDPKTGEETFVFSCYNQDQELDSVDFTNLNDRLKLNSLQEKLAHSVVNGILETSQVSRL